MNAYKRWIAATVCGSVRGRCGGWTRRMQRTFPELRLVGGFVARADMPPWAGAHLVHAHWWLVTAAGQVVDPTARQFGWPLVYIEIGDEAALRALAEDERHPHPTKAAPVGEEACHMADLDLAGYLCEQCLDAPAVAFVAAPGGGEMGVCAACGGLDPTEPPNPCVQHPLDRAHSPTPARYGPTVAVTCGVCGVRCVTTAVRWQAEVERRRALAAEAEV